MGDYLYNGFDYGDIYRPYRNFDSLVPLDRPLDRPLDLVAPAYDYGLGGPLFQGPYGGYGNISRERIKRCLIDRSFARARFILRQYRIPFRIIDINSHRLPHNEVVIPFRADLILYVPRRFCNVWEALRFVERHPEYAYVQDVVFC